jgi:hypothetical protein
MTQLLIAILYGIVGCFGALSIGLTIGGYGMYLARVGIEGRSDGIRLMEWGLSTLFVVMCVAVLTRFLT